MFHKSSCRPAARRALIIALLALTPVLGSALPALAHDHAVRDGDQVIANGQAHPAFNPDGTSCVGDDPIGPAWYGLESAHHGPDSGTPGKADECYKADAYPPGLDDNNPAIG
jgi:hypothetical protein